MERASSRAGTLPDWATLRLMQGLPRKAQEQKRIGGDGGGGQSWKPRPAWGGWEEEGACRGPDSRLCKHLVLCGWARSGPLGLTVQ